ncbi:hypothetical protein PR202_ga07358 [Eleusine coracana subsp. coracana]|uniref:Uncharacterized protein n=1 Tax=Eleusine coracana subsp. coracana TaxID=191504 RepID=A0AAV5BZT1_ELECO|nr:hypothetical protein PR202_ga07358 [Eleusine coracana subsp. coracana]
MEVVGRDFPHLKRLRLNSRWFDIELEEFRDNYLVHGIAKSMLELRDLQLFANRLHNNALYDILDKCPHLESLDLRHCFNIEVNAELKAKCSKLKDVRLPKDSTKDYECETLIKTLQLGSLLFEARQFPYHGFPDSDNDDDDDGDSDEVKKSDGDNDEDHEDDDEDDEANISYYLLRLALGL